ncbi:hypothetical protein FACS189499_02540 [Clostridia bacterium]|nr:hypothetical protein FACS189499_02540 [Clostridia bacterium]
MAEFKYEITKELGVIGETGRGWTLELNLVSWNEHDPKYDIRSWAPDHVRMGKGISLSEEEMESMIKLFEARNEEDSFE